MNVVCQGNCGAVIDLLIVISVVIGVSPRPFVTYDAVNEWAKMQLKVRSTVAVEVVVRHRCHAVPTGDLRACFGACCKCQARNDQEDAHEA